MLLAHLSDFHLFADRPETSLVRLDVEAACRRVVADVVALSPAVDVCVITGDLTDGGSAADYRLFMDVISPIKAAVFVIPGNHDRRGTLREAFSGVLPFASDSELFYEVRLRGLRLLALDTLIEGNPVGRLSPEQLSWLEARLAVPVEELTLVLMHHPAFPSAILPLDRISLLEGRERFREIVGNYKGTLRIHAGHIHRPFQTMWNGIPCYVAGSPAFQHELTLDPAAPEPGPVAEPYAYFLHKMDGPRTVSVHARYVSL